MFEFGLSEALKSGQELSRIHKPHFFMNAELPVCCLTNYHKGALSKVTFHHMMVPVYKPPDRSLTSVAV